VKGNLYTLCYAAVLGSACAIVLTFAATFTAPYKQANAEAEEARNVLLALKVPFPPEASSRQILEIRDQNVKEKKLGDVVTYVYSDASGKTLAVALRFSGPGLWAPIKGFLALEPDMKTIRGLTFYEQEETPGLGGEITSDWFRSNFAGKSIIGPDGKPGIEIRTGASGPNQIDAISGATMTCDKVEAMLNQAIRSIVQEN